MMSGKGLESREISDTVRESSKAAGVTLYGPEKIAAGPDIDGKEIIIVEGRADVITMLKAGIKNVIALQGKKIPKSVIGLVRGKEATVFIDGDRGGDLIIRQLATVIKINYISKAPDGKEVEELTQKEILKCLKKRMTYPMFMKSITGQRTSTYQQRPTTQRPTTQRYQPRPFLKREPMVRKEIPFQADIKKLEGSLTATIIDSKKKKKEKIEVKNLTKEIEKAKDVKSIIFDGVITQRLVDLAKEKKVETIVGIKKGKIDNTGDVKVYTLN
jgi:DNA primase